MTAQTQLLRAAIKARSEISFFLNACSPLEIRQAYMPLNRVEQRLIGAIARYRREKKRRII